MFLWLPVLLSSKQLDLMTCYFLLGVSFAQCPSARTRPKINIGCCWGESDSQRPHERDDASLKSFKCGKLRLPFRGAEIAFGTGRVRLATAGVSGLATIFKGNTVELVQVHPSKSARKTPAQSVNPRAADDIFGCRGGRSCASCEPLGKKTWNPVPVLPNPGPSRRVSLHNAQHHANVTVETNRYGS